MTEQEAKSIIDRLTRIWAPEGIMEVFLYPSSGLSLYLQRFDGFHMEYSCSSLMSSNSLTFSPGPDSWYLKYHRNAIRPFIRRDSKEHEEEGRRCVAEYLPLFRRNCWLSGLLIETTAEERATWVQGFNQEEIALWNLRAQDGSGHIELFPPINDSLKPEHLDYQNLDWQSERIAAAFEVEEWEESNEGFGPAIKTFCGQSRGLEVGWGLRSGSCWLRWLSIGKADRFCHLSANEHDKWNCLGDMQFGGLLARGLYCLGFQDENVLEQLPSLTGHEKLELRLSLPHKFWPQKWLDEEIQ